MFIFISDFLKEVIKNSIEYIMQYLSMILFDLIVDPTSKMEGISFTPIFEFIKSIGISYCSLKFVLKLFNIYILRTDGDDDNPPQILLINFIKSLAFIFSFEDLFKVFIDIMEEISSQTLGLIGSVPSTDVTDKLLPDTISFFAMIVILIGIVMYLILYIHCLKSGVLILVLRVGFPFVASGLMDANNGMFSTYIQKFLQLTFSVIIKMSLLKLGLVLLLNNHPIWSIIVLTAGSSVENMLKEFMLTSTGSFGKNISGGIMTLANIRRIRKV